jgi:hypothetical protein
MQSCSAKQERERPGVEWSLTDVAWDIALPDEQRANLCVMRALTKSTSLLIASILLARTHC